LLTVVAGIHPASPGFKTVRMEPHLGRLTHLDAAMPHEGGEIHVEYELNGRQWSAHVALPAGMTGDLVWKGTRSPLHGGAQVLQLP
jgi:hypothetical protein